MINYLLPKDWIKYDKLAVADALVEARASILCLRTVHYQRRWVDELQKLELKREVAGTSNSEGADFTDHELDEALTKNPEELKARAQKQAAAALRAYRWIATVPGDRPLTADLIRVIHSKIVEGADDDHCAPGRLRRQDENVNFGMPRHRGSEGGQECQEAFTALIKALRGEYQEHDLIIQALAAHYHLASMHPFEDGNGRTARALEALMLRRAGLKDSSFIAMSNYYYDEKSAYLTVLAEVRQKEHDLTHFLLFALKGVASQAKRVLDEIQLHVSRAIFKDLAYELFTRLKSPRKRAIAKRQLDLLNHLLAVNKLDYFDFFKANLGKYHGLKNPQKALIRDLTNLNNLKAIAFEKAGENRWNIFVRLQWPTEITETEFFRKLKELPKAKTLAYLHSD